MDRQLTSAEEYQLKLIYAAVFTVLGFEKEEVAQLQRTILGGIRSMPFQEAIAGHGGSGSVKYGDRYPPLSKCITAFKTSLGSVPIDVARDWWLWLGRDSHDKLLLRYSRQYGSTIKICSCIGFAIRWQTQFNGRQVLERGEIYYLDKDPDYINQLKSDKTMLTGLDNMNRPVFMIRCKFHSPKAQSRDTIRRLCVLVFETVQICQNKDIDGCTIVYDLRDWSTRNKDPALLKFVLQNMSKVFPCITAQLVFHMAGPTFKAMLKVVTLGLDTANKAKIKFTNSLDDLMEYIPLDQLPRHLGGSSTIGDIGWIPPREEDDICMRDRETHDTLQAERGKLLETFNKGIIKWIDGDPFKDRSELVGRISDIYWKLDPYVRSRTIWDRQGVVGLCRPDLVKGNADDVYDITYWNRIANGGADSGDESEFDQLTTYTAQSLHEQEMNFLSQDPLAETIPAISEPQQVREEPLQVPVQSGVQVPLQASLQQQSMQNPPKHTMQAPNGVHISLPTRMERMEPPVQQMAQRAPLQRVEPFQSTTDGYQYLDTYEPMYAPPPPSHILPAHMMGPSAAQVMHQFHPMEGAVDPHAQGQYRAPQHQPLPEEFIAYQDFIRSGHFNTHQ